MILLNTEEFSETVEKREQHNQLVADLIAIQTLSNEHFKEPKE
jgi:hypothetical protein